MHQPVVFVTSAGAGKQAVETRPGSECRNEHEALGKKFAKFCYSSASAAFMDGFFERYAELHPRRGKRRRL